MKKYTVISIQPKSLAPKLQRVLAAKPQDIMTHYQGDVYYIIEGHPLLEGEQGNESFLEVLTMPENKSFHQLYIESVSKTILDKAQEIIDSDKSWEEKYDLIFSGEYSKEFRRINPQFDYCDPDSSYEDDVRA